jgi:hypothetical protein
MTRIEKIEREIATMSGTELSEFRRWFSEFDASAWDREFEADANSGALDVFAEEALADHRSGRSRPR